jgi:thiol-disulfide isomerase/thioredoxin
MSVETLKTNESLEKYISDNDTVVVDFYAQWCVSPETEVLIPGKNNTWKRAEDLVIGDSVESYNEDFNKFDIAKITYIKKVSGKLSTLILVNGLQLNSEIDHIVLTNNGFKKISEIDKDNDLIGTYNNNDADDVLRREKNQNLMEDSDATILESTDDAFSDKALKSFGLLPLKYNNPKLIVLAKLAGYLLTDGYLYRDKRHNITESHFFLGNDDDVEDLTRDLNFLGFNQFEVKRDTRNRTAVYNGKIRNYTISCLRLRILKKSFFYLMKSLGITVGRKKNQPSFVPEWIMNSNIEIKKAFMSGWIGGDGTKISIHKITGYLGINDIEFHKDDVYEKNGIEYAKQLSTLFNYLGVETREIFSEKDEDGVIIHLPISSNYFSLFELSKIGYGYCSQKSEKLSNLKNYLNYKINDRLNIIPDAYKTFFESGNYPRINTRQTNTESDFNLWEKTKMNHKLQFLKIKEIMFKNINSEFISISLDKDFAFITNGIISHNCGPCKSLSPYLDAASEKYKDTIKVAKVDIELNKDAVKKYGITSIPCVLVFKKGKQVDKMVGFTGPIKIEELFSKNK